MRTQLAAAALVAAAVIPASASLASASPVVPQRGQSWAAVVVPERGQSWVALPEANKWRTVSRIAGRTFLAGLIRLPAGYCTCNVTSPRV